VPTFRPFSENDSSGRGTKRTHMDDISGTTRPPGGEEDTNPSNEDMFTSFGFEQVASEALPMPSFPPGAVPVSAVPVNVNDPRAVFSVHVVAEDFGDEQEEVASSRSSRVCDPQLSGQTTEERRKATVAMMGRKAALIEKVENFIAPRMLAGEENRGTKEPHKRHPKYYRYYEYLSADLLKFKYNEFSQDNSEEEAISLATSFCHEALPDNIFTCNMPNGTQHKSLKNPETKEFNCDGCRNRDGWSRSPKLKISEICDAHGIPNAHEKFKEYELRAIEFQKADARTCQRLTERAKDLGLYAYVWISDPNIRLPVHSTGRKEEGRFKKLKTEGRISDEHKNVYTDVSHQTNKDECKGFTPKMPDKNGCCAETCVPCHFAWINEKNIEFFDQQTVGRFDPSEFDGEYDMSEIEALLEKKK